MHPMLMNAIAADQIKDMRADAARARRARVVRRARLDGRRTAATRLARNQAAAPTAAGRELSERPA